MEKEFTDRDGKRWHAYLYNTGTAMGTDGAIPDAGEDMIGFKHPTMHSPKEGYATAYPGLWDLNKMTDAELQELLDRASDR